MDSQQHARPPRLFCPYARFENEEDEFRSIQFGESPILLPSSSSHILPLDWCDNKDHKYDGSSCRDCGKPLAGTEFYSCKECKTHYHKECIEPITRHPYHPKHSLRFIIYDLYDNLISRLRRRYACCSCHSDFLDRVYSCSLCNFTLCQGCAREPPLLEIHHPKRHEHTLSYFIRKGSFTCDVCALSCDTYPVIGQKLSFSRLLIYFCLKCDFFVHKDCIYLPWIIRISRHEHRLSFDDSLAPQRRSCGVCHGKIDTNYGRYSCVKGCSYGVHSKCATQKAIWDGKELEGEPEDAYEEDLKSFIEISDGIIQHCIHPDHHMQLGKGTDKTRLEEKKHCQACAFPIYDDDDIVYNCMQCDFILHEACAHLPGKKRHAVHCHPLRLIMIDKVGWLRCYACRRVSNGFAYACGECGFTLGLCCASVSEPLDYPCHPHLLVFTAAPGIAERCSVCQELQKHRLACGECDFIVCFKCATLPNKQRYKHDEHFLFLSYDKKASGQYWCDVCEEEADPKKEQVYMCNECNITLHTNCLLGQEMYIMPGRSVKCDGLNADILPNNHLTRKTCKTCHNCCQGKIVYKISEEETGCSFFCLLRIFNE